MAKLIAWQSRRRHQYHSFAQALALPRLTNLNVPKLPEPL